MIDSMNRYGNTLALALAGNEVLKPNSSAPEVAEPPRPTSAA